MQKRDPRLYLILVVLLFCAQLGVFRFLINPLIGKEWYVRQYLSAVPFLEPPDMPGLYQSRLVTAEKPPLFFLIGAAVYKFLGFKPQNIYWLNIGCSAVILWLTYAIGAALFKSRKTGLFAAVTLALMPNFVIASREEGMELPLTALVCLAMWILARAWPDLRWKHALIAILIMTIAAQIRKFAPVFLAGPFLWLGIQAFRMNLEQASPKEHAVNPLPLILAAVTALATALMAVNHFQGAGMDGDPVTLSPAVYADLILISALLVGLFHWAVCSRSQKLRPRWPALFGLFLLAVNLILFGIRFGGLIPGHSYAADAAEGYRALRDGRLAALPEWSRLSWRHLVGLGLGFNAAPILYFLAVLRPIREGKALPGMGKLLDRKALIPWLWAMLVFLLPLIPLAVWMRHGGNAEQAVGNVVHQAAYAPFSGLTPLVMILMPWFPFLLILIGRLLRRMPVDQAQWLALSWLGFPLLVFSLIVISRHARHALPLLPAVALLIGRGLDSLRPDKKRRRYLLMTAAAAAYAFVALSVPGLGDRPATRILTAPVVYLQARTDASSLPRQNADPEAVLKSIQGHLLAESENPTLFIPSSLAVPALTREGLAIYSGLEPREMNEMVFRVSVIEEGEMPPESTDLVLVGAPSKVYDKMVGKGFIDIETYPLKVHYYTAVALSFLDGEGWQPKDYIHNVLHLMKRASD